MKLHERIDDRLRDFILEQPVFFVGTAPLSAAGHVNVSPKGMRGTLAVLGEHRVAYLDYVASGAETIAHLRENGRIVLMFCAFSGPPNVVRLHGHGRVLLPGDDGFAELETHFAGQPRHARRSIIDVRIDRVSDSCGFSVPRMDYVEDRDLLTRHFSRKDEQQVEDYKALKNSYSIDGLPALGSKQTLVESVSAAGEQAVRQTG
ncbi:pyridoxamine 5'-phosphate oxidase family protein [Fodinicola acaciae]|uniref:pyridoxamine 5'-phosphate oxidase family protein n=1 Tax=Fodinicola acaciae TaxID=2681555 RepID=UPI0013D6E0D7|nr:pyridoxamine 5'-phosphate oxidase family protein [Fodinicola acaciae]